MKTPKTLVLTGAHPDDESFGIGGTLAHYIVAGYNVYYVCGTRGEAGEVPPHMLKDFKSVADLRTHEMECAAKVLGLKDVIYLGYRDSGMMGSPDNKHPNALAAAPTEQVAKKIVKILRKLKPEVVITSDPKGGYGHPDHIAIHKATMMAFKACSDPKKYPEAGPPFQPQKLYYHVFPHRLLKFMVRMMKFFGRDVHHIGRNKDIDMEAFLEPDFPIHAVIRISKKANAIHNEAMRCHASQLPPGGGPRRGGLMGFMNKIRGPHDHYTRVHPPVKGHVHENDLFKGVKGDKL
jgi:N-acetyl-1-D-myo-inositol-2-amino-2-deoxy-alpha-D-glucopyranoside deacetylase